MFAGLSALELGRLRLSVGHAGNKLGRPLSPVEVGSLLQKAISEGKTLKECAAAIRIDASNISRFLKLLSLPDSIQHLIDWGSEKGFIGFTSATHLSKLHSSDDQCKLAQTLISSEFTSVEVNQIVQLRKRSNRSIEDCVEEVIGMRPTIEKRYVFIGSIDSKYFKAMSNFTQIERDSILKSGIEAIGLQDAVGRLGAQIFTLTGPESFGDSLANVGKEQIEIKLRSFIAEFIENANSTS